jgi:hypothetical protein
MYWRLPAVNVNIRHIGQRPANSIRPQVNPVRNLMDSQPIVILTQQRPYCGVL